MRNANLPELVARAQAGDADAFGELVRRHQDMAVAYAWGVLADADAAEDAAQDAFVEAIRAIGSLREPVAFASWLRRIVFKHCDRQTRGRARRFVPLDAVSEPVADPADPLLSLERADLGRALGDSLLALPEAERVAIALHYMAGEPLGRLAAFLGVPVGTVKSRLYRGRRRLGKELSARMDEYGSDRRPSRDTQFAERVARLIRAAAEGDVTRVGAALAVEPELVNEEGPHPYWGGRPTALHAAVEWGEAAVVRALLAAGADPNAATAAYGFWPPLLLAIVRGHPEVARLLVEAGATDDVHTASAVGDEQRLRQLLVTDSGGASRHGPSEGTALHFAATAAVARLLLDHGADPAARDVYGNTPVRSAAARRRGDVVRLLLPLGPAPDIHLLTALGHADEVAGRIRSEPALLRSETFQHDVLGGYGTPLHVAAHLGLVRMIELLLSLGADRGQPNRERVTPLHYAAAAGHVDAVRALLDAGADLRVRDAVYDATPRDWADFQRKAGMVALLDEWTGPAGDNG